MYIYIYQRQERLPREVQTVGFRVSNRAGRGMNVVLFSAVKRVPASDYILSAAITSVRVTTLPLLGGVSILRTVPEYYFPAQEALVMQENNFEDFLFNPL